MRTHALAFSPIEKMSDVLIIPRIMLGRGRSVSPKGSNCAACAHAARGRAVGSCHLQASCRRMPHRFGRVLPVDRATGFGDVAADISFNNFGTSVVLISTAPGSSTGHARYLARAISSIRDLFRRTLSTRP